MKFKISLIRATESNVFKIQLSIIGGDIMNELIDVEFYSHI